MRLLSLFVVSFLFLSCQSPRKSGQVEVKQSRTDWTSTMRDLEKGLTELAPKVFNSKKFNDPAERPKISEEINRLAMASKEVVHNPTLIARDPTVRFISNQFAVDLQRAEQSFRQGKNDYTRYQLMKVTSYCIDCHTRMPQGPEFRFAESPSFMNELSSLNQAELLTASRKFDGAFGILIGELQSTNEQSFGAHEDMAKLALQIAVQYEQDPQKALKVIEAVKQSPKSTYSLKMQADYWKKSVDQWQKEKVKPRTLLAVQKLSQMRTSEVDSMRVIPASLQILVTNPDRKTLGETLLLAGKAYEDLSGFSPSDLHENYYRSCIQNVPHTDTAEKCYRSLEDSIRVGYSGSSGVHIPVEIEIELSQLKKLAE